MAADLKGKDYILFNHGVYTRDRRPVPTYANSLFKLIQNYCPNRNLVMAPLYWGDVNQQEEDNLLATLKHSSIWEKLYFLPFRETQLMQFIGDTALYTSRFCGAKVVNKLADDAAKYLNNFNSKEDRLHIVAHSLGTVILFDVLFSARWDNYALCNDNIAAIRNRLFGVPLKPTDSTLSNPEGIRLSSISTMGSPLSFFSLMSVTGDTIDTTTAKDDQGNVIGTHDITPSLRSLLAGLHEKQGGKPLPWYNFVHPSDPIAYPLEKLLPQLVDETNQFVEVHDIITDTIPLIDQLEPFHQIPITLLLSGQAHDSYWDSDVVAQHIAAVIVASAPLAGPPER